MRETCGGCVCEKICFFLYMFINQIITDNKKSRKQLKEATPRGWIIISVCVFC